MRIISGILAIALIMISVAYAGEKGQQNAANKKVASLEGQLASTNIKITSLTGDLAPANAMVNSLTNNLAISNAQASNFTANITRAISQINTLKSQLTTGHVLINPTYTNMLAFIASDNTDKIQYQANKFECWDFAADVINHAASQSIRCAIVMIDLNSTDGHAIVGFNTTDKGMVYIEPQSDELVQLKVGGRFYQQKVTKPGYYYAPPNYDDTVVRFKLVW